MPQLAAPDVLNYSFGAHEILVGAGPGVSMGNVVNARMTLTVEELELFSALFGEAQPHPNFVKRLDINIEASFDEPNKVNLLKFFAATNPSADIMAVGMAPSQISQVIFKAIPIVGNSFTWTIPRAVIRPSGDFGYTSDEWAAFSLSFRVLYDPANPTAPYGNIQHDGVT